MTDPLTIQVATSAEAARVGAVVAEAFHDDPVTESIMPVRADRAGILPRYFAAATEQAVEAGCVYVLGDFDAVAVWFDATSPMPAPPREPTSELAELCGPYTASFHRLEQLMHDAQPDGPPHHYLAFLAVRDGLRGKGLGSVLLERHHAHLDPSGLGAYLDASSENSRRLYLRHGYRDLQDPFHLPDGTPMWPMWRPPGGAGR